SEPRREAIFQQQWLEQSSRPIRRSNCVYLAERGFLHEKDLCSAASASFYSSACCTACSRPRTGCACTRPTLSNDPVVGCQTFRRLQPLRFGEIRLAVGRRLGVLSRQDRLEQRTASSG